MYWASAESVLNKVWTCPEQGMFSTVVSLNTAYTVFRNPRSWTFIVVWNSLNCVERGSVYFIICPKQEPKTEGVVLHRVAILGLFGLEHAGSRFHTLSDTPN